MRAQPYAPFACGLLHMSTIAERFLALRGNTKQGDFAKMLKINPNTLRNYENGRVFPNQEILERICVEFSVCPDWLILGRGPMRQDGILQTQKTNTETPMLRHEVVVSCTRCVELKAELELEKAERREVSAENRSLWRENGDLRERCAKIEEQLARRNTRKAADTAYVESA